MWITADSYDPGIPDGKGMRVGFNTDHIVRIVDAIRTRQPRKGKPEVLESIFDTTEIDFEEGTGWERLVLCPACTDKIVEAMGGKAL